MRQLTPIQARILASIQVDEQTGCWMWGLQTDHGGYGHMKYQGRKLGAHRVAFEAFIGPIPQGLQIDHLCKRPGCVNPAHLEPVTPQVNVLRSDTPNAVTSRTNRCRRGHELTPDNIYVTVGRGVQQRQCRACCLAWHQTHRARKAGDA